MRYKYDAVVREKDTQIEYLNRDLQASCTQNGSFASSLVNLNDSYKVATSTLATAAAGSARDAARLAVDNRLLTNKNSALSAELSKKESRADVGVIKNLVRRF